MGEVTMATDGLLTKIHALFNSSLYSDVQFVFMNKDGTSERIYCHKLILALHSKVFALQFFEKDPSPSVMKMQASTRQLFWLLFKFLYTGEVQFHTYEEAQDLYELATDYQVEALVKKCHDYILQGRLTFINIFSKYEHALKRQFGVLLKDCRNFVCAHADAVFESDEFVNASPEVLEDIIKLDDLSLSTEFYLIKAVLSWASENLKRKEVPVNEKNLRNSINPFLKHLRILSLTSEEFQTLVMQYNNIFDSYESTILFQKILIPESNSKLPENFCPIATKRGTAVLSHRILTERRNELNESEQYDFVNFQSTSLKSVQSNSHNYKLQSNSLKSVQSNSHNSKLQSNSLKLVSTNSQNSVRSTSPKSVWSDPPKSTRLDLPKSQQCDNNKLSYEVRKRSPKNSNTSSGSKQKFNSSPILDIKFPPPNFSPNHLRDFLFPLKESEKSFKLSFRKDIKCSIVMTLKSGNLALHGFEMKVKSRSEKKEHLEVSVDLLGFSKQRFEKSYNMELQNDVFRVTFPQPMKLQEGCKGKLEVCIDDLFLDRCFQIGKKQYELNCGLNFECDLSIDSNNKTQDGENLVFLINKLIYVPY